MNVTTTISMLKLVWRIICYIPWAFLFFLIIVTAFQFYPLIPGFLLQNFFNTLSSKQPPDNTIWQYILLFAAMIVARAVVTFFLANIGAFCSFVVSSLIRQNVLQRILTLPGAHALPDSPAEAVNRFRDDASQIANLIELLIDTCGLFFFTIAVFIVLFHINVAITLFIFVPTLGVVIVAHILKERITLYRSASRDATGRVSSLMSEIFKVIQTIQVYQAENTIIDRFRKLSDQRRVAMLKDQLLTLTLDTIFSNTLGLGMVIVLIVLSLSQQNRTLGAGDVAVFIYYISYASLFISRIGAFLPFWNQTKVSVQRLAQLQQSPSVSTLAHHNPLYLRKAPSLSDHPITPPVESLKTLRISNLTYHYPNSKRGIEHINLTIPQGSLVVITGRVGSGKTTLLRTLLGLLPQQTGEIYWNEKHITHPSTFFIPPQSAYVPQRTQLFSGTLTENVLLGLPADNDALTHAFHTAVMDYDLQELPAGRATTVGAQGVKLSGGQIQRTAAAQAFYRNPQLLVLDDLSSALDIKTEKELWNRLSTQSNITCLAVSHHKAMLQRADHILLLDQGKVIAQGTLPHLLTTQPIMQQLWTTSNP